MINNKILYYIKEFIKRLNISDYIGIIVYGSYVGERSNDLSDLDIMIIKKDYNTSDCGSIVIDGVRIEYFIQSLNYLYTSIKEEINNNDPSHLTKFATCEIIYDKDGLIQEFIDYANSLYNIKINSSFDDFDKFSIFSINNRLEDLETLINSTSFYAVYYVILEKIRILYSKINGFIELPLTKIETLYTDKELAQKYISSPFHTLPNQEFIDLYIQCLKIVPPTKMLENIKKLYAYSFKNLNFEPTNFCLKFSKKPPFRV